MMSKIAHFLALPDGEVIHMAWPMKSLRRKIYSQMRMGSKRIQNCHDSLCENGIWQRNRGSGS